MKTKKNNILVILICAYYMEYSFANNLKIKKYYKEPEGTYNLVSTVVFRLENNYKPMSNYHDKFMFMLQNFKRTFRGNYYLRVYFDRSIYVKTDNDIINKEIDEMWKPLLKYLKSLSFVQLVRYNHLDFKKNKTFHDGLFGTLIRFLPLFDYESNKNIRTIVITDIDVNKTYLNYTSRCIQYVKQKNLKFFFRTSFCKFIKGRHYTAKGIVNTWLRVMAGTVICDNYKFSHQILDDFFKQLYTKEYDSNVDKFVNIFTQQSNSHDNMLKALLMFYRIINAEIPTKLLELRQSFCNQVRQVSSNKPKKELAMKSRKELDDVKRLRLIIEEVDRLSNLTEVELFEFIDNVKPIVEHNLNTLRSKPYYGHLHKLIG